MNILATSFSLATNSLDIYLAGCKGPHCGNCHNPESWDFDAGLKINPARLLHDDQFHGGFNNMADPWVNNTRIKVVEFADLLQNIMIMGGEPLDQPLDELRDFLNYLSIFGLPIWLFTHYSLEDIPFSIRVKCAYIKTGRYDETQLSKTNIHYGVQLASANQVIHKKGVDY